MEDFDEIYEKYNNIAEEKIEVKPKRKITKPKTEKQMEAFKKAREVRAQKISERKAIKQETGKEKKNIEELYKQFIKDKMSQPKEEIKEEIKEKPIKKERKKSL